MGDFFGRYLIEKNIVNPKDVINALCTQMESQPSTLRILREKNLLSENKIIEIINYISNTSKSIISAIKEMNLLTDDQILEVSVERTRLGLSFAEALLQHVSIDPSKLKELHSEYETHRKSLGPTQSNEIDIKPTEITPSNIEENQSEINSAALESLKELGMMDELEISSLGKDTATDESNISFDFNEKNDTGSEINTAALESLRELGMLDESELAKLEKEITQDTVVEKEIVENDKKDIATSEEFEVNAAALESLKELGMLEESGLAELEGSLKSPNEMGSDMLQEEGLVFHGVSNDFLKTFDESSYKKLSDAHRNMALGLEKEYVSEIYKLICEILEAARIAGLKFSEKLFNCWEGILSKILNDQIDFAQVNMLSISKAFKETILLSKELRDSIEKTNSESELMTDDEWKSKFIATLKNCLTIENKNKSES